LQPLPSQPPPSRPRRPTRRAVGRNASRSTRVLLHFSLLTATKSRREKNQPQNRVVRTALASSGEARGCRDHGLGPVLSCGRHPCRPWVGLRRRGARLRPHGGQPRRLHAREADPGLRAGSCYGCAKPALLGATGTGRVPASSTTALTARTASASRPAAFGNPRMQIVLCRVLIRQAPRLSDFRGGPGGQRPSCRLRENRGSASTDVDDGARLRLGWLRRSAGTMHLCALCVYK
jgi:hypothetical protein